MTVLEDVATLLRADGTLAGYLTGGIFGDAADGASPAGAEEISRSRTPAAFDANGEIQPVILLKNEQTVGRDGMVDHGADTYLAIFFYQRRGYDSIRPAMARVYALLHRQPLAGYLLVRRVNELDSLRDPGLDSSMTQQRYQLTKIVI